MWDRPKTSTSGGTGQFGTVPDLSPPRELAVLDGPVVAEEAGAQDARRALHEHVGREHEEVGKADPAREVGKPVGEAQAGEARAGDDADGEVAADPERPDEDAGEVLTLQLAVADADRAALDQQALAPHQLL